MRLLVEIEITNPVHWTVRAFIDPPDLRAMIKIILTSPGLILSCLKFLFTKGPRYDEPAQAGTPVAAAVPRPGPAAPAQVEHRAGADRPQAHSRKEKVNV